MEAASAITQSPAPEQSHAEKLVRAAHQFEALLLNQLLGSLEQTFSALGKHKSEAGSDQYQFLGVQALASNIAAHGGIGIADMIVRSLKQAESRGLISGEAIKKEKP